MKEYTILCILTLAAVFIADFILKTRVTKRMMFYYVLAFAIFTQLIVDNLTAWTGFWNFNEQTMIGVLVPVIPFENLLFGLPFFTQA